MMQTNEFVRVEQVASDPSHITYSLTIDWDAIRVAFKTMAQATEKAAESMTRSLHSMSKMLHRVANDETRLAGLEGRYYVAGALLCPDIDALVRTILHGPAETASDEEGLLMDLLTPVSRARLAAKAIEGYVQHNAVEPTGGLPWHRYLAGARVTVS